MQYMDKEHYIKVKDGYVHVEFWFDTETQERASDMINFILHDNASE